MCNVADDLKNPLYKVTAEGSRGARDVFNKLGWQNFENEADRNVSNPGHAIGQAAKYTAMYYLGGLLGGGAGAGADAATQAATTAADEATQQAAREALIKAAMEGQDVGYVPEVHGLLTGTASNAPE